MKEGNEIRREVEKEEKNVLKNEGRMRGNGENEIAEKAE